MDMAELYINAKDCINGGNAVVPQALRHSIVDKVVQYACETRPLNRVVLDLTSIQGLPVYAVDIERVLRPEFKVYGALGGLVNDLEDEMRKRNITLEILRHMPGPEDKFAYML